MSGKLIIFSGPSGTGKTTIVKNMLQKNPSLEFSISACSRAKREGEVDGRDYYFLTSEEFKNKIDKGQFIEWQEVYAGNYYGTLKTEIERIHHKGHHVVFDIDVKGAINIKKMFPANSLSLFIMPPSLDELKNRLVKRSTENAQTLSKRLAKAEEEISFSDKFDKVIVNKNLDTACLETYIAIEDFIHQP